MNNVIYVSVEKLKDIKSFSKLSIFNRITEYDTLKNISEILKKIEKYNIEERKYDVCSFDKYKYNKYVNKLNKIFNNFNVILI